jgi:hypothetical protein
MRYAKYIKYINMDSFGQGTKRKREKEEPTNPKDIGGDVDMHDT